MSNGIAPFTTDLEVITFAKRFLGGRISGFRKDVAICLTANENRTYAYFPALMTCVGFLDLLSGLYSGNIMTHGIKELNDYANNFMDRTKYTTLSLAILYEGFRHKIAHLSHPYFVFDTATKAGFPGPRRLITWTVYASDRGMPIELISYQQRQLMTKTYTPWLVEYDHRVRISIHRIKVDAVNSVYGSRGYLQRLEIDRRRRENFTKAMLQFFPV